MKYKFGFALTTALGNKTRYINLKKYADRDEECDCIWAPITHHLNPDPYEKFPHLIHHHLLLKQQAAPVLQQWQNLDALVVHAFQLYSYLTLYKPLQKRPQLVLYQDYAPIREISMLNNYGHEIKDDWRRKFRFMIEVWFARRADLYIVWSEWAKNLFINNCNVSPEKIHVVNIGVDLELWPYIEQPSQTANQTDKPRILFVGGDFHRKGGDTLLKVYLQHFANSAHLDLVTKQPPPELKHKNIHIYTDLKPNDPRLKQLYADCAVFVLPTTADMSSLVSLEAMATGRPVIATRVGGIPDIVNDGNTGFLIEPDDEEALKEKLELLIENPALRETMGKEGRRLVECKFNAEKGAAQLLSILKAAHTAKV